MKRKYLFMAAVAVAALLTGCGPKEEPTDGAVLESIRITPSSISLLEGETYPLRIKYTPEEAKETAPAVIWYSERQRVASVDDNGLVTADRVGTTVITAQCGKLEATCIVDVLKNDLPTPDPDVKFSVEPKKIESPAEGGTFGISVKSNVAWTAEPENSEWATLNATSGEGDAELTLTVAGSEDPEVVSQDITFTAGKGKYYVRVTRTGYVKVAQLTLDKTEADVAVSGGSVTVNVESEAEWNVSCDDPHVSVSKSGNTATITVEKFNLSEEYLKELYGKNVTGYTFCNLKDEERGFAIPVTFSNGDQDRTVTVYQEYPYIIVSIDGLDTDYTWTSWNKAEAHDFIMHIEANIPWAITFKFDNDQSNWATVSQSSGSGNATVTLHFTENTSGSTRTGYCYVNSAGGYTPFSAAYLKGAPNLKHGWQ